MKIFTILRDNWKKTVFGIGVGIYGYHSALQASKISSLMKCYCEEAAVYGNRNDQHPQRVAVILNPAAKNKKSEKDFKKYCEPILHLAGLKVDIVRTSSEGYAKTYVEELNSLPNTIAVAGGDGTVSEILTGMMRRNRDRCPIALLPLGTRNDIAKKYLNLSFSSKLQEVESLLKASMAIARSLFEEKSVIKIEQISSDDHLKARPIYAFGYLQWGISRDMVSLQEKYWYFGTARAYISVLLNAFNSKLTWNCKANVNYSLPCTGCTNCLSFNDDEKVNRTWLTGFLRKSLLNKKNHIQKNAYCEEQYGHEIDSSNVSIYADDTSELSKLVLQTQGNIKPGLSFLYKYLENIRILSAEQSKWQSIDCRTISLLPDELCKGDSKSFFIDNEIFDVRPMKLTLMPKAIQLCI